MNEKETKKTPLFYILSSDTKCKNNKAPLCASLKVAYYSLLFCCVCVHTYLCVSNSFIFLIILFSRSRCQL